VMANPEHLALLEQVQLDGLKGEFTGKKPDLTKSSRLISGCQPGREANSSKG